ncbi:hypothetical protein BCR37DRAFT_393248 [Protomyces lactucae-debilis]|uniref:Uncharacterized protein n=1 Tax=Protomyces lactucae-debilis TaxID=2754530 RepID=A0A1Y2FBT5_PROLT|nr:uncharacterized protein BCR37DRAFT_393248 [Protomyces lactucae-debilis]ORY81373.1 hypothetical protein BCR37DRAFT_393248 [Protomyces lactucae-debilis]
MFRFLRSIIADDAAVLIEIAVKDYVTNQEKKLDSIDSLRSLLTDANQQEFVECLARHLGPRWNDTTAWCREEDCIVLLQRLGTEATVEAVARDEDMMYLLDYHLRACLLTNRSSSKQIRLARAIQQYLDEVCTAYIVTVVLQPLFDLQYKYKDVWANSMLSARDRVSRYRSNHVGNQTRNSEIEAKILREKMPIATAVHIQRANILAFDMLKEVIGNDAVIAKEIWANEAPKTPVQDLQR